MLLCYSCLGPHCKKTPDACHAPCPITKADIEQSKLEDADTWAKELKQLYQSHLQAHRALLLEQKAKFVEERLNTLQSLFD